MASWRPADTIQGNNGQLPANSIFRLNLDGVWIRPFPISTTGIEGGLNNVNAILIQPDQNILIGGEFSVVSGAASTWRWPGWSA